MLPHVIDREEIVKLFHDLMNRSRPTLRMLRLYGDSKMGKSHLVTQMFPTIARIEYDVDIVPIDFRGKLSSFELLSLACNFLGGFNKFPSFRACYQEFIGHGRVEINNTFAIFSHISIVNEGRDEMRLRLDQLTTEFVEDMSRLKRNRHVLFIFDHVDDTNPETQLWLTHIFITRLLMLENVSIVMAGKKLPEMSSYDLSLATSIPLQPVLKIEAYIAYCKKINAILSETSITDFAKAFDYNPGMFAEIVLSRFTSRDY